MQTAKNPAQGTEDDKGIASAVIDKATISGGRDSGWLEGEAVRWRDRGISDFAGPAPLSRRVLSKSDSLASQTCGLLWSLGTCEKMPGLKSQLASSLDQKRGS